MAFGLFFKSSLYFIPAPTQVLIQLWQNEWEFIQLLCRTFLGWYILEGFVEAEKVSGGAKRLTYACAITKKQALKSQYKVPIYFFQGWTEEPAVTCVMVSVLPLHFLQYYVVSSSRGRGTNKKGLLSSCSLFVTLRKPWLTSVEDMILDKIVFGLIQLLCSFALHCLVFSSSLRKLHRKLLFCFSVGVFQAGLL